MPFPEGWTELAEGDFDTYVGSLPEIEQGDPNGTVYVSDEFPFGTLRQSYDILVFTIGTATEEPEEEGDCVVPTATASSPCAPSVTTSLSPCPSAAVVVSALCPPSSIITLPGEVADAPTAWDEEGAVWDGDGVWL